MRSIFILLMICLLSFEMGAQSNKNTIAWYEADTIMKFMPMHKLHQDSLAQLKADLNKELVDIGLKREYKARSLAEDSAKMSALMLSLKKRELADLDTTYALFKAYAEQYLESRDSLYRQQEIAVIHEAALKVIAQKGFKEVHEHEEMPHVLDAAPTNVMTYNITWLVIEEMKLK